MAKEYTFTVVITCRAETFERAKLGVEIACNAGAGMRLETISPAKEDISTRDIQNKIPL